MPRHFAAGIGARGRKLHDDLAREICRSTPKQIPSWPTSGGGWKPASCRPGWDSDLPAFPADAKGMASRISSGKVLNAIAKHVPWLIGGAADLAPSTMTHLTFDGAGDFEAGNYGGRNFHFGIREHGMAAMLNGMALSYVRPFGATFFVFTDYLRPSMRLSAIMRLPVIYDLHARFDRLGRRRSDASAGRASGRRPGHSQSAHHAARPMPTKWSRPGA